MLALFYFLPSLGELFAVRQIYIIESIFSFVKQNIKRSGVTSHRANVSGEITHCAGHINHFVLIQQIFF